MIFGPCANKILIILINSALATSQAALPSIFAISVNGNYILHHIAINLLGNPFGATLKYRELEHLSPPLSLPRHNFLWLELLQ